MLGEQRSSTDQRHSQFADVTDRELDQRWAPATVAHISEEATMQAIEEDYEETLKAVRGIRAEKMQPFLGSIASKRAQERSDA